MGDPVGSVETVGVAREHIGPQARVSTQVHTLLARGLSRHGVSGVEKK